MRRFLWSTPGEGHSRLDLDQPLWLKANGAVKIVPAGEQYADSVMVIPIDPIGQVVGVALVPFQDTGRVARNKIALASGIHELRHADRLDVEEATFWVAIEFSAEETEYDPARHPPDAFCFLTKGRLNEGDPIVVCPGTADKSCGVIYRQAAWQMAQTSPTAFRCPNCGFAPRKGPWTPPARGAAPSLDALFQLAVEGGR